MKLNFKELLEETKYFAENEKKFMNNLYQNLFLLLL